MTRAIDDAFEDPDGTPASRGLTRFAHALLPIAVLVLIGRLAEVFGWIPGWLSIGLSIVMTATFLTATSHHLAARLCIRCMAEVPANAPVRAQRRGVRLLLRLEHVMTAGWRSVALWAGIAAVVIGVDNLGGSVLAGRWAVFGGDVLYFVGIYAAWIHHQVRPWCPYCPRWDGGHGPHECTPAPDPTQVKVA